MTDAPSRFVSAQQIKTWGAVALIGPPGTGKTYSALELAAEFEKTTGRPTVLIDSEHGSAAKYGHLFDFQTQPDTIDDFDPQLLIDMIGVAVTEGFGQLIVDSGSHWWNGVGGLLDRVEQYAAKKSINGFKAWGEYGTPMQKRIIDTLLAAPIHVFFTMRSKIEWEVGKDANDKMTVKKIGTKATQRDDVEYEFDFTCRMRRVDIGLHPGGVIMDVDKARAPWAAGQSFFAPFAESFAAPLLEWLNLGADAPAPNLEAIKLPDGWQRALKEEMDKNSVTAEDVQAIVGLTDTGRLGVRDWILDQPTRTIESLVHEAVGVNLDRLMDPAPADPAARPAAPEPMEVSNGQG